MQAELLARALNQKDILTNPERKGELAEMIMNSLPMQGGLAQSYMKALGNPKTIKGLQSNLGKAKSRYDRAMEVNEIDKGLAAMGGKIQDKGILQDIPVMEEVGTQLFNRAMR